MDCASLPDLDSLDVEALKALVIRHQAEIAVQRAEIAARDAEIEQQRQTLSDEIEELRRSSSEQIEHLKLVIEKLRRRVFGVKSEKIVIQLEQLELHLEELESSQAEMEAAAERVMPAAEPKTRSRRKPLPEHLPREVVTHAFQGHGCPDCGGQLRQFGEDVSEQLEYIPDSFKVIRHVRPKFACSGCERVIEAPAPSRPIERGLAGPGLLAHVLVSKFADHLPLYRQSEIYARQGVEIERSTLAGWVGGASELLAPLIDAIQKHVLAGAKLHADDTPIPVLAPGSGKTKTGRLWTYVRDDRPAGEDAAPAVWFAYSEDRKGEHPRQHLKNFKGGLQADAYAGFHHLYGDGAIYEVACWAHARRKFHEIHVIHASPTTTEALARIGALYAIEDEVRGKPADLRLSVRQARAKPLLNDVRKWMEKALRSLSAKSETAGAIRYALSRWRALTRYTDDGLLEIDNSAAERALRAVALGRKNYLFAGSDCGGERAAGDRESDIYELFCLAQELHTHFLVRTCVDRLAGEGTTTVVAEMKGSDLRGLHSLQVLNKHGEVSTAVLELRFRRMVVRPPKGKQKYYPELILTAIHATETNVPKDRERIEWKLLTNLPVRSCLDAIEKLEWYAQRWKIETFHKILKSGCKAEEAKLRTAERLVNLIAILTILSWRIFWITMLNRTRHDAAPTEAFTELDQYLLDELVPNKGSPPVAPSLGYYIVKLARLGGYLARAHDPPPGNTVIWRGLSRLTDIELGIMIGAQLVGN